MSYLELKDKYIYINKAIFEYTNRIKLICDDTELAVMTKYDTLKYKYEAIKGKIVKLYLEIENNWFYYEKIIIYDKNFTINQTQIKKYLKDRKELIKEIIGYGAK